MVSRWGFCLFVRQGRYLDQSGPRSHESSLAALSHQRWATDLLRRAGRMGGRVIANSQPTFPLFFRRHVGISRKRCMADKERNFGIQNCRYFLWFWDIILDFDALTSRSFLFQNQPLSSLEQALSTCTAPVIFPWSSSTIHPPSRRWSAEEAIWFLICLKGCLEKWGRQLFQILMWHSLCHNLEEIIRRSVDKWPSMQIITMLQRIYRGAYSIHCYGRDFTSLCTLRLMVWSLVCTGKGPWWITRSRSGIARTI